MFDNGECVVKYSPWSAEVCGSVYEFEGFGCGQSISTSEWVKASDSVVVKDGPSIRSLQPPHNPTNPTEYVLHSPTPHPWPLKTQWLLPIQICDVKLSGYTKVEFSAN